MRVDFDRAIQVVRAATEFDWTWTAADLPAFSERTGWELTRPDHRYPVLTTNLDINRTDASVSLDNNTGKPDVLRPLNQISFYITDVVLNDPSVQPALDEMFEQLAQRVFDFVGRRPTGWWVEPTRGLRWYLPSVVVTLSVSDTSVRVYLVSPEYQKWNDENERSLEDD